MRFKLECRFVSSHFNERTLTLKTWNDRGIMVLHCSSKLQLLMHNTSFVDEHCPRCIAILIYLLIISFEISKKKTYFHETNKGFSELLNFDGWAGRVGTRSLLVFIKIWIDLSTYLYRVSSSAQLHYLIFRYYCCFVGRFT